MPPGESVMKKIAETSSLVKETLDQSALESDDDDVNVTTVDPMPDFKPIIDLPDEVEVCTGEENENVLFDKRAKLFRFVNKEWKERGIGQLKLLENKDSKKVRLLMRREAVHKICANHFLHADMELKPMAKTDKAYIWFAKDYADEVVSDEQLCVRFKTADEAEEFKAVFNKYKLANSTPIKPNTESKTSGVKATGGSAAGGFSKELTQVKPGSWECKQCYVMNTTGVKCVACGSDNPQNETSISTPASNKYQLGGLTFSSTPVLKKEETDASKAKPEAAKPGSTVAPATNPLSFIFSSVSTPPTSNPFASLGGGANASFKFGSTPSKTESEGFPTLKNLLSSPAALNTGVDFASLAKSKPSASPFSSATSGGFTGFPGAGTPLFSGSKTTDNHNTSAGNDDDTTGGDGEEFVPTAEFKPVIALPDIVNVVTGEEGCEVVWECRSKLLRYDASLKEWKERGLGQMKLLKDSAQSIVRLLMRREQVLKVCCNQRVTRDFELKALNTSDKAWTWHNQDFSDGESKNELFALKFKTCEQAQEFKSKIDQVVAELRVSPSPTKPTTAGSSKPATDVSKPSLSSLFKPSAGSWECAGCFVRNPADVTCCPACNSMKPGCEKEKKKEEAPEQRFSFGVPSTGSTAPPVAVPQFKPTNTSAASFVFGIPASTTSTPSAEPVSLTKPSATRSAPNFLFGANSAKPSFSFGSKPDVKEMKMEPNTPEKTISQEENNAFRFGSSKFSFSGIKPASPRQHNTSGGYRTESESEADTTVEEENDIHFQPVIPLPPLVKPTTGEENETILYEHRAKLFRYMGGDWKERGVGNVKLLKHNDTGKLRFIMRREPIEKICLNHFVDGTLHMTLKDEKTWLWATKDYSEGEWLDEKFAMRFKTSEIAQEFKRAVDAAVGNERLPEPSTSRNNSSSDEIEVIYEKVPQYTAEEKANIIKYKLPPLFYEYKNKTPCPGCVGCKEDVPESATSFLPPTTKHTTTSSPFLLPPSLTKSAVSKQSSSTPAGTPASLSFASSASPIVFGSEKTNDSLSSLDSQKFATPTANIFSITSDTASTGSNTSQSIFKSSATTPDNLFAKTNTSVFGQAAKFGMNVSLFGGAGTGGDEKKGDAATSTSVFGKNFFSGTGETKSLFGASATSGGAGLFTSTTSPGNFFGLKSSKLESVVPAPQQESSITTLPTSGGQGSLFNAATQPSFGSLTNKATPPVTSNTPEKEKTSTDKTAKESNTGSSVVSTPSFLENVDTAPSFADLATNSNTSLKPFSAEGKFQWEGAGSSVFGNTSANKGNTSTNGEDEEGGEDDGAEGEHDPHFEPIIDLPDIVDVKTGEEEETKLFGERCKLYRYDKETKQWKDRGVGEIKLLHHPEKLTYRILMRREQIHKTVANFLLWPGLSLKPIESSDRAWLFTVMNLAEDYEEPEEEQLAVQFKDTEQAEEFKRIVEETTHKVAEIKANSSLRSDTTQSTVHGSDNEDEEVDVEDVEEEEIEGEEDSDDEDIEYLKYEIVDEEDEIDYDCMFKMDTIVEHPVTLLKKESGKWETVGNGRAKINTSSAGSHYECRVQVVDNEDEITLDTVIAEDSTFESKGKAIVWRGVDESTEEMQAQDFMLKFSSDDHRDTFLQFLQESVQICRDFHEG